MAAVLNEQMLLVSAYERDDIEQAREEVVEILREMNEKSELTFMEEWCGVWRELKSVLPEIENDNNELLVEIIRGILMYKTQRGI